MRFFNPEKFQFYFKDVIDIKVQMIDRITSPTHNIGAAKENREQAKRAEDRLRHSVEAFI